MRQRWSGSLSIQCPVRGGISTDHGGAAMKRSEERMLLAAFEKAKVNVQRSLKSLVEYKKSDSPAFSQALSLCSPILISNGQYMKKRKC